MKPARGWIYNEVTGERLDFQFNPEVEDRKSTAFASLAVPGLSHPVLQFQAGEARVISFTLMFSAFHGDRDILRDIRWIQSLQYPTWEEGVLQAAPPRVVFSMGPHLTIRGVVRNVQVRYGRWTPDLSRLLEGSVSVQIEEYVERSVDAAMILRGYAGSSVR